MLELVKSGGWLMLPILVCSLVAVAIFIERSWILRSSRVVPSDLIERISERLRQHGFVDSNLLNELDKCPLGTILAAGLRKSEFGVDAVKDSMEQKASQVTIELERYLTALGTVAQISPLLGLLGTVIGMIQVFTTLVASGGGDPTLLAGGISQALITTATGISVAIVALVCHRYFLRRVDKLVVAMEQQAGTLVEMLVRDFDVEEH